MSHVTLCHANPNIALVVSFRMIWWIVSLVLVLFRTFLIFALLEQQILRDI